jgi:hypothetical protein
MKNTSTAIEYEYRDAGNYKVWATFLIEGVFSDAVIKLLKERLLDGEFFIPEDIDVLPLQPLLWEEFDGSNGDDHNWHSICNIRIATDEDMDFPVWGEKYQFLKRLLFMKQKNSVRLQPTQIKSLSEVDMV